jgi:hypothetical protein
MRVLDENEQYASHGVLQTEAPGRIILIADTHADGVHDDHLLNIDMQLKVGCVFDDRNSNTMWNKEYTLWWEVNQTCTDDAGNTVILKWNGTQVDGDDGTSPSWSALPRGVLPAPYMFVDPGTRCSIDNVDNELQGGLTWFGAYVPPPIRVISPTSDSGSPRSSPALDSTTLVISVVAVAMGAISVAFWTVFICARLRDRKQFVERLLGTEYCTPKELSTISRT